MKNVIKIIILGLVLAFGVSVVYADKIEGSWKVDKVKMKKIVLAMPKNEQAMIAFFITINDELVFYKNGKVNVPTASLVGTWKKAKKGYQLIINGETSKVYLSRGSLKLIPPANISKQAILYKHQSASVQSSANNDKKIKRMIQYGRRYYRTTRASNGSENYLVVNQKTHTCSFVTVQSNTKGKSKSKLSDKCHVMNGYLQMGPILGNAKVVSPKKIINGKYTYILR